MQKIIASPFCPILSCKIPRQWDAWFHNSPPQMLLPAIKVTISWINWIIGRKSAPDAWIRKGKGKGDFGRLEEGARRTSRWELRAQPVNQSKGEKWTDKNGQYSRNNRGNVGEREEKWCKIHTPRVWAEQIMTHWMMDSLLLLQLQYDGWGVRRS